MHPKTLCNVHIDIQWYESLGLGSTGLFLQMKGSLPRECNIPICPTPTGVLNAPWNAVSEGSQKQHFKWYYNLGCCGGGGGKKVTLLCFTAEPGYTIFAV